MNTNCMCCLPIGQTAPERGREELDERPGTDEQTALAGIHAHLLEVDAHQWEQGPECRVEEEIERLDGEQLLVHRPEYQLDQVRLATYPVGRVLWLRIVFRIHLAECFGVHAWPDASRGKRGPSGLARYLVRRCHANNNDDGHGRRGRNENRLTNNDTVPVTCDRLCAEGGPPRGALHSTEGVGAMRSQRPVRPFPNDQKAPSPPTKLYSFLPLFSAKVRYYYIFDTVYSNNGMSCASF